MFTRNTRGLTIVEALVATSIFSIAAVLAMTSIVELMRLIDTQSTVVRADEQANGALKTISEYLRPAILPVALNYGSLGLDESARNARGNIFSYVDSRTLGFSNSNGEQWLRRLQEGMDSIAFVHPIDAQLVGDYIDDANNIQIGYQRNGVNYMSARPAGTPGSGSDFYIGYQGSGSGAVPSSPVNALTAISPDEFTSETFEKIDKPTAADLQQAAATGASIPPISTFMAIRFVPRLTTSGDLVEISEENIFRSNRSVDLDGDGLANSRFHIGKLQLLYSGSAETATVRLGGNDTRTLVSGTNLEPITIDLTPDTVLRRAERNNRVPIFRLVNYSGDNLLPAGAGNAGMIDEGNADDTTVKAVSVRLLILDTPALDDNNRPITSTLVQSLSARWYNTMVYLKNMER